jgi:hypothetical protein
MGKSVIVINGQRFEIEGDCNNVSISNGEIRIGGNVIQSGLSGIVKVEWSGPLANLSADAGVTINGNVKGSVKAGTSVNCGDVGGDVKAGTGVNCGKVGGSVQAGTSIRMQ